MDLSGQLPLHLCSLDGRTQTDRQTEILSPQLSHMCLLVLQTALKHHQTVTVGKIKTFPLLVSLTGVIVGATVAKEKWNCFYIFLRVAAINNTAQNV